jgi:hypothetical protein
MSLLKYLLPLNSTKTLFNIVTNVLNIIVLLIAIFFGVLISSEKARQFVFYHFAMTVIIADKPSDALRCDHFRNVSGRVLEIGVGPGTNFRCWTGKIIYLIFI